MDCREEEWIAVNPSVSVNPAGPYELCITSAAVRAAKAFPRPPSVTLATMFAVFPAATSELKR